jgi:moderate conductance mechanosensitive channel
MTQTYQNAWSSLLAPWLLNHGVRILVIVVAAIVVRAIGALFIRKTVRRMVIHRHDTSPEAEKKREDTLVSVFSGALQAVIWVIAIIMIIAEFGLDIGPVLAAAGVVGLAIGFGAQYLIRDLISGFFIVLENQYRVGDVVCVGTTCGLVEGINLRHTILRDMDGTVHHIPNGAIQIASNMSKGHSCVNLNVGVGYGSDLEKVIRVVNGVGKGLAEDPAWKAAILSPPQFLRVDDFGDSAIVIKVTGNTQPIKQWDVTGELRKRLKIAFDKEGIEIPFPQRVVHQAQK